MTASSTLPILSKTAYIDGVPYIDGGVANAIPFAKAIKDGYRKIVIVLTRSDGYESRENELFNMVLRTYYHKYPQLVKKLCTMSKRYNLLLRQIKELESQNKIFVIRPITSLKVKRIEQNKEKLRLLYLEGKEDARRRLPDMIDYIKR